ncbi:ABC transporter substrate-binding protein [Roseococcus pinisoli]|uniref:ABC transporter substrate-binding protein n=1 Tax=Roseococcus pinisoli TaxID=2835040 RepID=A0ABS5QH61_9PROT|nr:ABC transporter substrate-binding protein [Roseococcus pinisoli]MBS7812976.1 ABC transporter substrate-binding protein [Roseococcus pinisoli]
MIGRRQLLGAAGAGAVAQPALVAAQNQRVLKFVPQADLALLDPVQTTGLVTRNHGLLVFDTLYGVDMDLRPHPQMVEGHVVENDGLLWKMRLRPNLRFHDGEPVRARDCVASIRRWASRDAYAATMMAAVDELSAPDDREIRFRLKHPFPLLPDVLGKPGTNVCVIMPERLAAQDGLRQVTEMVGSGPYRFVANERIAGSRAVYAKFDGYVPRESGTPNYLSGPKHVHFDRVEWLTMPDAATAAAALQRGEIDWWDQPLSDFLPLLQRRRDLKVEVLDTLGFLPMLRFNHLLPPFDNPAIRRAMLGAIRQADYMIAVAGEDRSRWREDVGFFAPGSPMANDAGLEALRGPRDFDAVKRALQEAGYRGERIVFPVPTDFAALNAMSEVAGDMFRRIGLNLDYQALDWGTVLQRVASQQPADQGGWHIWANYTLGVSCVNPASQAYLRGIGRATTFGWPTSPGLEALRDRWFQAPDLAAQQAACREMQALAFQEVPYLPLGVFYQPTAYRSNLEGVLKGFPLFWNVRRA